MHMEYIFDSFCSVSSRPIIIYMESIFLSGLHLICLKTNVFLADRDWKQTSILLTVYVFRVLWQIMWM